MLDVGTVIERSFSVYSRRFLVLTSIGCLAMIPVIVVTLLALDSMTEPTVYWSLGVFQVMISYIVQGAITFTAVFALHGRPTTFQDALAGGLARLFPVIGVSLLAAMAVVLGLVLFIVPGLILGVSIAVVIPVTVLEKHSLTGSLSRSLELTKGSRWRIFGVLLIVGLIGGIFSWFVELMFEPLATPDGIGLYVTSVVLLQSIPTVLSAVAVAVMYEDLRVMYQLSQGEADEVVDVADNPTEA